MNKAEIFWPFAMMGIAACIFACIFYRPTKYLIFGILIFSLFFESLSITFMFEQGYRGTTRGFEIYLADMMAIVLITVMVMQGYRITWFPKLTISYFLFVIVSVVSWSFVPSAVYNPLSTSPIMEIATDSVFLKSSFATGHYPLFEIAKLLRIYMIFWVTVNFVRDIQSIHTISITIALMLFYAGIAALVHRYVLGYHRVSLLSDTNIFNCFVGMLASYALPFAFYYRSPFKSIFYWSAVIAGLLAIILTVSRSSLLGFIVASLISVILMLRRFYTLQNIGAIAIVSVVGLALVGKAASTLTERFFKYEATGSSLVERELYNSEAILMGNDHLFGVGLNNYSAMSISEYAVRVNKEPGALAHNMWYLTFAETGWPGLLTFTFFWLCFYKLFFHCCRKEAYQRDQLTYAVLTGIFAAMLIMQFQDLFHFSYRHTSIAFLSSIFIGIVVRIYMIQRSPQHHLPNG